MKTNKTRNRKIRTVENPIKETNRKYFSMIPHLIDDLPLSPSEVRLYLHYKRRAGELADGRCFESTENIAKFLHMGKSTVCMARKKLHFFRLIEVIKIPRGHGEFPYCEVRIRDIWDLNCQYYDYKDSNNQSEELKDLKNIFDEYHGKD